MRLNRRMTVLLRQMEGNLGRRKTEEAKVKHAFSNPVTAAYTRTTTLPDISQQYQNSIDANDLNSKKLEN